jgi:8-oxo-dGTP pyrophosphatase MutT (NUDIX family)
MSGGFILKPKENHMTHEVKIHEAQTTILRELLFKPQAGYAELQKQTDLTSDHFNFHVARLVELGFVEKVAKGSYRLTHRGKEYANKLDTDSNTIERQPKSAVLLAVEKTVGGKQLYLFQERLKHPYYGFRGLISGKIRWGETIIETAERELMEEAGIRADWTYGGIYHEHARVEGNDELLEDKIFHVIRGTNPRGTLMEQFEGGRNAWLTAKEVLAQDKVYPSTAYELDMAQGRLPILEKTILYPSDRF